MLTQYHNHTYQQPDCVFFTCREHNWLVFSELVNECLKLFQKHTAASLSDGAHGSE